MDLHLSQITLCGKGGNGSKLTSAIVESCARPDIAKRVVCDGISQKGEILTQGIEYGLSCPA